MAEVIFFACWGLIGFATTVGIFLAYYDEISLNEGFSILSIALFGSIGGPIVLLAVIFGLICSRWGNTIIWKRNDKDRQYE